MCTKLDIGTFADSMDHLKPKLNSGIASGPTIIGFASFLCIDNVYLSPRYTNAS
jgi:hypothetical protein